MGNRKSQRSQKRRPPRKASTSQGLPAPSPRPRCFEGFPLPSSGLTTPQPGAPSRRLLPEAPQLEIGLGSEIRIFLSYALKDEQKMFGLVRPLVDMLTFFVK